MTPPMRIAIFAHSWRSDWNHGNAHFLRGLASELIKLGHQVFCYEPEGSWSQTNLLQEEHGKQAIAEFERSFPELHVRPYKDDQSFEALVQLRLRDVDVVLVHEWNSENVINTLADLKPSLGYHLLFHDTHHRAYTAPKELLKYRLGDFDGVLAFGEALRAIYQQGFGVKKVWTFHEAADTAHFRPLKPATKTTDVIWIGNWGDEERTRELEEFLISPAESCGAKFTVHGVRYPEEGRKRLGEAGIQFRGYLPNLAAPQAYAQSCLTLHVPRRCYANGLSGIPTIRVFEAMACGIPLLCSPWSDVEALFRPGQDYLCVPDGKSMAAEIRHLLHDQRARQQLAQSGLQTIREHHTCAHRAQQLISICEEVAR